MNKRKVQKTLDYFLAKKSKPNDDTPIPAVETPNDNVDQLEQHDDATISSTGVIGSSEEVTPSPCALDVASSSASAQYLGDVDVGSYIHQDKSSISDLEKYNILKHAFVPVPTIYFKFPYSLHSKKQKDVKCFLSVKHFNSFSWLTYSKSLAGLFCKFCVLFAKSGGIHKSTPLNKFVLSPVQKYSKLLGKDGDLITHDSARYHLEAVMFGSDFMKTYEDPQKQIRNILDTKRLEQVKNNREKLKSVINTIHFLGRQNIPLRGHRVHSEVTGDAETNEGNLREFIRNRIETCGDDLMLKSHFESSTARSKYISPSIQNEIINCCGNEILNCIVNKIKACKYYSVIFDETTDISKISQMSLVVRYLDENCSIREDFLGFIDCHHENYDDFTQEPILSGTILGQTVVANLNKLGLPLDTCVGIGTDTCSVMLSDQQGAVSEMKKTLRAAIKSPCYNHSLNLSISRSSNIQDIRNAVGTMKESIAFFNASSKRNNVLKFINHEQLTRLCETRWVERHESVLKFKLCFENIIYALELISQWKDNDSSTKAQLLMNSMLTTNFIFSLFTLSYFLSLTVNLSKLLQKKSLDTVMAQLLIDNIISVLNEKRETADSCFKFIFEEAEGLHRKLNIPILVPRTTARQRHRPNIDTNNTLDYFKISIFIPLLDHVIQDLRFRFNSDTFTALEINSLIPSYIVKKTRTDLITSKSNIVKYLSKFSDENHDLISVTLESELELWKNKWSKFNGDMPDTAIDTLHLCESELYPRIYLALKILCVLPVSVATAERSFSSLKRLKTWLRSTMSQERLVGLALMHIHRDIEISPDSVLDRFASLRRRNLDLII